MNENILKQALEQALDESYNEMIDQDIPDYDFSPDFKARMEKLILSQQTQPEKKKSRMLWFTAMAAAAALLAVTIGLNSSARPTLDHDKQKEILSETTVANTTSFKDTTGTSAAVTETHTTSAVTSSRKNVSDKSTETSVSGTITQSVKTTAVKGTSARNNSSSLSQTVASTAVSASVSVTGITTTVTDDSVDTASERKLSMNKISTFFKALMATIDTPSFAPGINGHETLVPIFNSNADDIKVPGSSPFIESCYYNEGNFLDYIPKLHEDESSLDFNKDGQFDLNDVYIFYMFYNGVDFKDPEKYDFSGVTPENDEIYYCSYSFEQIVKYFATYYTVKPEYLDPEAFKNFFTNITSQDYLNKREDYSEKLCRQFPLELSFYTGTIFQFYDLFRDITVNNNINLDVSGDGVFDFDDIYLFSIFDYSMNSIDFLFSDDVEEFLRSPIINKYVPHEIIDRCVDIMKQYKYNGSYPMRDSIHRYMLQYYLEAHSFDPAYTDDKFYWDTYPEYEYDYAPSFDLSGDIAAVQYNLGYGNGPMRYYYPESSKENLMNEYEIFKKQVDSGQRSIPDLNMDGRITIVDYCLSDRLFDEYRYRKEIPFPEEYRQAFLTELDLNNNGMSADINDVTIYQFIIGEMLGMDRSQLYQASSQYYIDDPEFDPIKTGIEESSYFDYDEVLSYEEYLEEIYAGNNIEPDIDRDGKITIADYAYADILQSAKGSGNEYRTSIIPDDVKYYYLHECDFDKDGHCATDHDLELVQYYVGEELGLDIESENYAFYSTISDLAEDFISQFDDQLPQSERTIKAAFKPELIEGMTISQLHIMLFDSEGYFYVENNKDELRRNITDAQKKMLDTNLNGTIEPEDYVIANDLYESYMIDAYINSDDIDLLTQERKDNFYKNFDFNGNGINCDSADMDWALLLYQEIFGTDEVESTYRHEAGEKKFQEELAKREEDNKRYHSEMLEAYHQYKAEAIEGSKPAPDVTRNGSIDIEDYAAINIAFGGSFRQSLFGKEVCDQIREVFDFTITSANDYTFNAESMIGLYVAETLGIDINDTQYYIKLSDLCDEYISQFDDQLEEYERSAVWYYDKELVKDMTYAQKRSIGSEYYAFPDKDVDPDSYCKDYIMNITEEQANSFDLNLNGTLEAEDYIIAAALNTAYSGYENLTDEEKALLNDDIKDNFYKNFDPDENGVCGDQLDIYIIYEAMNELYGIENFSRMYLSDTFPPDSYSINDLVKERNYDANQS